MEIYENMRLFHNNIAFYGIKRKCFLIFAFVKILNSIK